MKKVLGYDTRVLHVYVFHTFKKCKLVTLFAPVFLTKINCECSKYLY